MNDTLTMKKRQSRKIKPDRAFNHWKLGRWGENWLVQCLTERGISAELAGHGAGYDILAKMPETGVIVRIECKTARQGKDGRWKFTLWKQSKCGWTDHHKSDVVVFLAVDGENVHPFIVPIFEVSAQKQAVIATHPNRYSGKLSPFRRAWSQLENYNTGEL